MAVRADGVVVHRWAKNIIPLSRSCGFLLLSPRRAPWEGGRGHRCGAALARRLLSLAPDETGEGAGLGFNLNLPLPRGTGFEDWRAALAKALKAIDASGAEALVVSLGLDTFEGDPIAGFRLQSADYFRIGEDIAAAGLPTAFVFEGGYAVVEVGTNAVNLLEGFQRTGA